MLGGFRQNPVTKIFERIEIDDPDEVKEEPIVEVPKAPTQKGKPFLKK